MTAFNNLQLDEEHQDGAENHIREGSSDLVSYPNADSVSSEKTRFHIYKCCCNKDCIGCAEKSTNTSSKFSVVCCHDVLNSDLHSENFISKQEVLCFLKQELEQERIAAESAAKEAISMILRLQVEKAALQMEARHYQEFYEARTLYDEATISQLKDVISSQEADKLILEREIDECKQTLHMFTMQLDDRQAGSLLDEDGCKISRVSASAQNLMQKSLGVESKPEVGKGCFSPLLPKEKFDSISVDIRKGGKLMETLPLKEESKTKHVVSISSVSSTVNTGPRNFDSGAIAMSRGTCLPRVYHHLESLKSKFDTVVQNEQWFDDVVKECWLGILIQVSNLQNQLWSVGLSKLGAYHGFDNYEGCELIYKHDICTDAGWESLCSPCLQDAFCMEKCRLPKRSMPQSLDAGESKPSVLLDSCLHVSGLKNLGKGQGPYCASCKDFGELPQQEKAVPMHIGSWNEIMAVIDICLVNLEERFALFQRRLHALEVARRAMVEVADLMNIKQGKIQIILMKALNLLKEFLSLTGLGCDILDTLHKLVVDLTEASHLVQARCADTDLDSQKTKIYTGSVQDNIFTADTAPTGRQGDSSRSSSSTKSKLAFLWLSSLEWLSSEKCRAETAFSGWDHV
ncbi:hypothetical protein L7F22_015551 [Adiantum nelumboides]|nr:hypothetical protein [Adiantum nelumboides]